MPNIVLTRIDNRLIHGQVATQWTNVIGANLLLVANDKVSKDKMRQGLMDMAAPSGVATRYFSVQKTIDIISKAADRQKIFIICENPQDVLRLIEGGVPIDKVNVGNMHMAQGKRQVATSVAVDDSDVEAFKKIKEKGVELFIQRTPNIAKEDVSKILGE
ncbi:MAG: PTS galactosamine transporter subunit IIB [Tissierellia bacterium]|nr:PTS galactosamine transporter subunit IIB [Tissierellia bacterium]